MPKISEHKTEVSPKPKKKVKAPVVREEKVIEPKEPVMPKSESLENETDSMEGVEPFEIESAEERAKKPDRYFEAVGRRKTAIARVRLFTRAGDFSVNAKPYADFFKTFEQQRIVEEALQKMKLFGRFRVSVKVKGGGAHAQAEAIRHGLARCLTKFNPDFRKRLKRAGYLRRDPRMKERKKFGLKKARRAPQWQKR